MFTTNFWFQNRIRINFFQCREVIESDVFPALMIASSYGCSMSDIWSCFLSYNGVGFESKQQKYFNEHVLELI